MQSNDFLKLFTVFQKVRQPVEKTFFDRLKSPGFVSRGNVWRIALAAVAAAVENGVKLKAISALADGGMLKVHAQVKNLEWNRLGEDIEVGVESSRN